METESDQLKTYILFLMGVSLALDSMAVSITSGITSNPNWKQVLMMSTTFAFFQTVMPAIGYIGGKVIIRWIEAWDHWLALTILGFIGGKMVFEAFKELYENYKEKKATKELIEEEAVPEVVVTESNIEMDPTLQTENIDAPLRDESASPAPSSKKRPLQSYPVSVHGSCYFD
eukprot:NODE_5759_length_972_cov_42.475854_g5178_i0.p1 GENE.NODE_5759_length_972_cov_42.475854_g5178_i0~~NODE_5759_length_972_cov_42.475854_g5178_i0.p1  ORF type:complete len:194 (+),score=46.98 NODE_5759_length_972_cov_42.475854_g5178_i0:64-582(+)